MADPNISFVIASYNSERFLADAVRCALAQRRVSVEVLVVDDGSSDKSRAIAADLATRDPRVRAFTTPCNLGPGGARNIAIEQARGTWIAVLDSDDLLHPERSARLLAEADATGAEMIADDLLLFHDDFSAEPELFLDARRAAEPNWIDLPGYLNETLMFGRRPNLGFLKPMIRTAWLRRTGIRYDERLRIAEDDALAIALLRSGARYRLLPEPLYFYRKHGASISHRLSTLNVDGMSEAGARLRADLACSAELSRALAARDRALSRAWAFTHLIDALKARRWIPALRLIAQHPGILPMLRMPLGAALRRLAQPLRRPRPAPAADPRAVLFVSRQRLIGATNGSSAYLLAIAEAVRSAGFVPHLLQPSPAVFGRTPFYRLRPEMKVFDTIAVEGALSVAGRLIAREPQVWLAAAQGAIAATLRRIGVRGPWSQDRKLPPSISRPWDRASLLAVARRARLRPAVAIADYAFQAEALPLLISSSTRTATVMHDLFHARADQFRDGGDSVATLSAEREIAMLSSVDAVLAIQAAEAAVVAARAADTRVILAHMPARAVERPQTGEASRLLFVGSNTAPNVLGLEWFLNSVWPIVQAACPETRLDVGGTVNRAFPSAPKGVRFLGLVDDLAGCYAAAGLVISPLLHGSGLKIKLIEALAHGKACVVTEATLQGVHHTVSEAVACAQSSEEFAAAILGLVRNETARAALAQRALEAARTHFGAEASMAEFVEWLRA